ncbi:MAG: flavodoxin family protein [Syntrophales bacterium]|nr:flavodoxin family protein [Syntrophales bacterium]MDY0044935.1 flavodoxin family protein [Syntrophales bacterium]
MHILITYMSHTGNTKKVAEAIFDEIASGKEIKRFFEVTGTGGYDFIFEGFPIHAFGPPDQAKDFMKEFLKGKKAALFITHAAHEDLPELQQWLDRSKEAAGGAELLGTFNCQGELSEEIAEFMLDSGDPDLVAYAKNRSLTLGQPDADRLQKARDFARKIAAKLERYG